VSSVDVREPVHLSRGVVSSNIISNYILAVVVVWEGDKHQTQDGRDCIWIQYQTPDAKQSRLYLDPIPDTRRKTVATVSGSNTRHQTPDRRDCIWIQHQTPDARQSCMSLNPARNRLRVSPECAVSTRLHFDARGYICECVCISPHGVAYSFLFRR
jgi:hypothetical protein